MTGRKIFALTKRLWRRLTPIYQSLFFVPAVVCTVILVSTLWGVRSATISLQRDMENAAALHVNTFEKLLSSQLGAYEQILQGGVGLFQGSDDVTKQDFINYLAAFNLPHNFPAVQGIAYAQVVTERDLPKLIRYLESQGITTFQITPAEPPRDTFAAVLYAEMVASKNKNPRIGYDSYADPLRRAAMFVARDTGEAALTQPVQFATVDKGMSPTGFNMYVPYYGQMAPTTTEERQRTVRGYVYAAFLGDIFFADTSKQGDIKDLAYQITTQVDDKKVPLFTSATFKQARDDSNNIVIKRDFHIHNQTWHTHYVFKPSQLVSKIQLNRPGGILFFGIFSAVLITTILWLMLEGRGRALAIQKERDIELAKDELLSLASHQLRTPATGVKQYLGMVLQGFAGDVPRQQQKLLEKAYASNDRQLHSINEILHVAKINSGHIVLARQPTDLNGLLRDIVQEQQPDIASAGHTLRLNLPKRSVKLNADTHMVRMATENILSNAIKYTPPGGKIDLTLRRRARQTEIVVRDTGIGIKSEDFSKLFKQFSRLPNSVGHVSGTGVGLYLAKYLIELHGGTITIVSKPGKGSTFTITLPNHEDV